MISKQESVSSNNPPFVHATVNPSLDFQRLGEVLNHYIDLINKIQVVFASMRARMDAQETQIFELQNRVLDLHQRK